MTSFDIGLGGEALVRNQIGPAFLVCRVADSSWFSHPPSLSTDTTSPTMLSKVSNGLSPHLVSLAYHPVYFHYQQLSTLWQVSFFTYFFWLTRLCPAHPHDGPSELRLARHMGAENLPDE